VAAAANQRPTSGLAADASAIKGAAALRHYDISLAMTPRRISIPKTYKYIHGPIERTNLAGLNADGTSDRVRGAA